MQESAEYFSIAISMAKKARKLRTEKCILIEPNKKSGKKISEDNAKMYMGILPGWWMFILLPW